MRLTKNCSPYLKGVWTEKEKEEARSFYDVGEPELTTYCTFNALKK